MTPPSFQGRLASKALSLGGEDGKKPWGELALDPLGTLTLNGQVLALPFAQERRNFGVAFLDSSALPHLWRPAHAKGGGAIVASIEKASPLAIAGLRPFDLVSRLGTEPVASVEDLTRKLGAVPAGQAVRLEVETPEGHRVVEATAAPGYKDSTAVDVPFLFVWRKTRTSRALTIVEPYTLFYVWGGIADEKPALTVWIGLTDRKPGPEEGSVERTAMYQYLTWGLLLGLVERCWTRNLETGEESVAWKIFWGIPIGGSEGKRSGQEGSAP